MVVLVNIKKPMENITLALEYYKLKEKALIQRYYIDYTRAELAEKIKEDTSATGKAQLEAFDEETEAAEQDFQATVVAMQQVFDKLYPALEKLHASVKTPFLVDTEGIRAEFYIDDAKNIHYKKLD